VHGFEAFTTNKYVETLGVISVIRLEIGNTNDGQRGC
jgi:hypothetical protein